MDSPHKRAVMQKQFHHDSWWCQDISRPCAEFKPTTLIYTSLSHFCDVCSIILYIGLSVKVNFPTASPGFILGKGSANERRRYNQYPEWFLLLSASTCLRPSHVWTYLNLLCAIFFRENINISLHFMSFLHTNKTQVVEIPPRVTQGPAYST